MIPLDPRLGLGISNVIDEQQAILMADQDGQALAAKEQLSGMWKSQGSPFDEQKAIDAADQDALDLLQGQGSMTVEPMDEATKRRISDVESNATGKEYEPIGGMAGVPLPMRPRAARAVTGMGRPQEGPTVPTIGPMLPETKERYLKTPLPAPKPPKVDDFEYGRFAKFIDPVGQFATHFANMSAWGIPELVTRKLFKEELPAALSPVGSVAGAAGSLLGMGYGKNAMASSPFKVTGKVVERLTRYVPKTVVGQVFKDAIKSSIPLGLAMGATEWEGGNVEEIIKNKGKAFIEGTETGGIFFGTSFLALGKAYPLVARVLRFGITGALLDWKSGQRPWDERDLMQKAYDYGMNWLFTKHGQTPKEYIARESQARYMEKEKAELKAETARLNAELAKENMGWRIKTGPLVGPLEQERLDEALKGMVPTSARVPGEVPGGTFVEEGRGQRTSDRALAASAAARAQEARWAAGEEPFPLSGPEGPATIWPRRIEKGYVEPPLPEPPVRPRGSRGGQRLPDDAPDVWHDVLAVTGGRGIGSPRKAPAERAKENPLLADRVGQQDEFDLLPMKLKNRKGGMAMDEVIEMLQSGGETIRGNYAGMTANDIYDLILQRPGTSGVEREKTPAELRDIEIEAAKDALYGEVLDGAMKRIPSTQFNEDEIRAAMTEWERPAIEGKGPSEPWDIIDRFTAGKITAGQAERAFEDGIRKFIKKLPEPEFPFGEEAPKPEAPPVGAPGRGPTYTVEFGDRPVAKYWSAEQARDALDNLVFPEYKGGKVYINGPDGRVETAPPKSTYQKTYEETREAEPEEPVAPPAPKAEGKRPWEMTRKELIDAYETAKKLDKDAVTEVFGAEAGKRYDFLQRRANSTIIEPKLGDAAYAEIEKMEAGLTEKQRNRLFGIGEKGLVTEELREYIRAVELLDFESPEALGNSLKNSITRVGKGNNPAGMNLEERVAYTAIKEAYRIARENGWDTRIVSQRALRSASLRFAPEDVETMLGHFMNKPKAEAKPVGEGGAFDTTTTGMPYYDTLLKDPRYMESRKHRVGKIEYMSPDEYIRRSGANRTSPLSVEGEMVGTRPKRVSELEALVKAGTKMPMPVIDTADKAQEGRHRALAAKALGLKEIPVLVVSKGREVHEMSASEWLGDKIEHEMFVREALKRGDTVPPEVLADYPELAPRAEPKPLGEGRPFPGFDKAFTTIAKELGVDKIIVRPTGNTENALGPIYQNALANFTPTEGEAPEVGLRNFVARERNLIAAGREDAASGKSTFRERQREGGELKEEVAAESALGRKPEAESKEASVLDIIRESKAFSEEDKNAVEDRIAGVPYEKSRNVLAGKHGKTKEAGLVGESLIEKARKDPDTLSKMTALADKLDAKEKDGKELTPDEHASRFIAKVVRDGPNSVTLGMFHADMPDWAKEAMEKMGAAMKPVAQDVKSAGKERGRDILKRIREAGRMPQWSPKVAGFADFMLRVDAERDSATAKANRDAKPYIELERYDKAGYERVNQALIEGDKRHALIAEGELRSKFKLTDREVEAYKGVREAIRLMGKYEMDKNTKAIREKFDKDIKKVRSPEEQMSLEAARDEALKDVDKAYRNNPGYIPHMRFGRYAINIKGELLRDPEQGDLEGVTAEKPKAPITANFSAFAHESQARRFMGQYQVGQEVDFEGRRFRITEISEPIDLTEAKLTPHGFIQALYSFPVYEKMLEKRGAEHAEVEAVRKILGEETMKYYAKGRLARRKNIAGWDKNIGKSLESFFESFPRAVSRRYSVGKLEGMIDKLAGPDRDYGRRLLDYWSGKTKAEGAVNQGLRKVLYNWFLGFKPSFYFVNAMQPIQTTLPLAQSMVGLKKAGVAFAGASLKTTKIIRDWVKLRNQFKSVDLLDVIKDAKYLSVAEKRALASAWESGEIGASRTREIVGKKGLISTPMEAAGTLSEKQNRIHATLVGVEVARLKGMNTRQAIDLGRTFTGKSQFIYSKVTRMEVARGMAAPAFIFKSYMMNYWNLQKELFKTDKKAFVTSQAILMGLSGAAGYPLARETFELVVKGLRAVGILDDEKKFRQQVYDIERSVSKSKAGALLYGLPSLVDLDGPAMFGSGEFTGLAPMQIVKNTEFAIKGLARRKGADWLERAARMSPTMLKHALRFYQMVKKGTWPTDDYGKPKITDSDLKSFPAEVRVWAKEVRDDWPTVKETPMLTKILYGVGFPITQMREVQQGAYVVKGVARKVREEKGGFNLEIGKLIGEKMESKKGLAWLRRPTTTGTMLKGSFNAVLKMLDPSVKQKIMDSMAEAKKRGYEINYQSIMNQIREYLEGRE